VSPAKNSDAKKSHISNLKWVAGASLLLLLAHATRSGFVVYSLYAVLLVMLASRLIIEICLRGLDFERELSQIEITIGDRVDVILTVRNKGFLPIPWVLVEDLLPEKMPVTGQHARLFTLVPGGEEKMLYQVVFSRRGYHQIGPTLIETGDLFGFFRRYKSGSARQYVTVYPAVEMLGEYDISTKRPLGSVTVSNRIFEDPTKIVGVREYAPGDPFNRIHWKTSARTGKLHSKIWEPSRVIGATVVLDFHESSYRGLDGKEKAELAIILAASLSNYISSANEQVGFLTNGRDCAQVARWESQPMLGKIRRQVISRAMRAEKSKRLEPFMVPTRKGAEQSRLILEALARLDYTDGLKIESVLQYSMEHLSRNSTILVITPGLTDSMAIMMSIMKESGFLSNLFIVGDETDYFSAVGMLAAKSIPIYHIKDVAGISKYATRDIYY
jgi:uncharacterized protein (DUF58 family)